MNNSAYTIVAHLITRTPKGVAARIVKRWEVGGYMYLFPAPMWGEDWLLIVADQNKELGGWLLPGNSRYVNQFRIGIVAINFNDDGVAEESWTWPI